MTQPNPNPIDDDVIDVEVKHNFKQRQRQRIMRVVKATFNAFERLVEFCVFRRT